MHGRVLMNGETSKLQKIITIAAILDILGLISIIISLIKFTPITLIISVTFGGILVFIAILLYIFVVIQDLRMRKVL